MPKIDTRVAAVERWRQWWREKLPATRLWQAMLHLLMLLTPLTGAVPIQLMAP